jgi:hypothetical protein
MELKMKSRITQQSRTENHMERNRRHAKEKADNNR